jgi:EXS family
MSATQEVEEIFGQGNGPAHDMLRSPTVLIASIGLWGMNVYLFRVFGIDYVKVLKHDLLKLEEQDMGSNSQHGVPQQHKRAQRSNGNSGSGNRGILGGGMLVARKDSEYGADCDASFASDSVSKSGGGGGGGAPTDPIIFEDDEMAIMEAPLDDSHADRITSGRLIWLSFTLLLLLHSTYTIWIHWLGGGSISAVFAFYGAVTTAIMLPLPSTRWLRTSALLVIQRALELVNPRCYCCSRKHVLGSDEAGVVKAPRPIPFVDVFFADAMCSLSKVFFDWGLLLHKAAYYPNSVPKSVWHILIPSAAAAVPYIIRARQCLVMWSVTSLKNDPGRYQHLWNALKYCTSIFPLCLSAYQKTVSKDTAAKLDRYLIFLLVVNAAYALWWDVGTWIDIASRVASDRRILISESCAVAVQLWIGA